MSVKAISDTKREVLCQSRGFESPGSSRGMNAVNISSVTREASEAHANSIRQYLIDKFGINASRLTAVGYGLTRSITSNNTEEGRQKNRRVQAVMKAIKKN